jgi:alpha-tubulin suppressor-like RCC1 family protein
MLPNYLLKLLKEKKMKRKLSILKRLISFNYLVLGKLQLLSDKGIIYEWGGKNYQRDILEYDVKDILGLIPSQRKSQKRLENLKNIKVKMITCGEFHQLLLSEEGDVYSWGNNK